MSRTGAAGKCLTRALRPHSGRSYGRDAHVAGIVSFGLISVLVAGLRILAGDVRAAADFGYCELGGYKDTQVKATGFFHVKQVDDVSWLVDPHRHLFLSTSSNGLGGFGGGGRGRPPAAGEQPAPPPAPAQHPQAKNEIRIWKDGAPYSDPKHWPNPNYREEWQNNNQLVVGITEPTVCAFLPTQETNTGVAAIICPGGGYKNLYIEKEGYKIALALQERGIAGIVLKYRHYDIYAALEDAHRAVRFVRSKAKEWNINPQAIGIGGFSAGGHLALHSATNLSRAETWAHDEIDQMSKKPDFLMLVYPSLSVPKEASIDANTPASFIVNAADDTLTTPESAIEYFSTLKRLKVPAELHIYERGFHGFGLGTPDCQCGNWIDLFRNWLVVNKFISHNQ